MIIKDYDQILFNILKPLAFDDEENALPDGIKLYLNRIPEDFNSYPLNFIVYRSNITNTASQYGDGKVLFRKSNCDIMVNESGDGNQKDSGKIANQVEQLLIDHNIKYTRVNMGYVPDTDSIQTTFDFYL